MSQMEQQRTLSFSDHKLVDAREYVSNIDSKIVLIDGEQLAQLMIDHDVGVSRASVYEIKRVDSDYFAEVRRAELAREYLTRSQDQQDTSLPACDGVVCSRLSASTTCKNRSNPATLSAG